ncbi:hypothetical protein OA79_14540 [Marinomonas sp. TW1]|nr:hypothetical protein OA79_14540 [Marinomonas sp. TW1]
MIVKVLILNPLWMIVGVGSLVVFVGKAINSAFKKKKIFISYYYGKDRAFKRLLNAWSKNEKFDIDFEDTSADVSLDTSTDEELEYELTKRIKNSDIVLVLIGDHTHLREWVKYEIKEAVRLQKTIVAVKHTKSSKSPTELKGVGAHWVYGFRAKKVSDAIKNCV